MSSPSLDSSPLRQALAPDYVLEREIGRGGMGIVYLAHDVQLDRPVAVKVLPPHLAGTAEVRERFLREARTAAKLSHASIVPIFRADEREGIVFFVMAYVDGESLAERLAARGTLAPLAAAALLRDVAYALGYAHARGVVHRDVKPENILIERCGDEDRALVTDFGIARLAEARPLTATGQVLGTVHYMSPEQVSGEPLDGRSDLYSLGVVGFRALAGRLPFDSETASAVLVAHVTKMPPRLRDVAPHVPAALATVIDACLAKDPAARHRSGAELARALEEAEREIARVGDAAVVAPPVVSEREAQALWARAAELQAQTGMQPPVRPPGVASRPPTSAADERRTLTSGYRLDEVRDAAREAGIPDRYVERAAAELGLAPATPTPGSAMAGSSLPTIPPASGIAVDDRTRSPSALAGGPMVITFEAQVPGEMPDDDFEVVVEAIRRRMGDPGNAGVIGRTLSWSTSAAKRRVQISVVPRHGRTTIRAEERLGPLAGALFGGLLGGGGGGTTGISMGVGMGVFHSGLAAAGIWGAVFGSFYLLARTLFRTRADARRRDLRALVEEIRDIAAASIAGRALPSGEGP